MESDPERRAVMIIAPDPGPRYVMKRIKSDAARANREFLLTLQDIKDLIHEPCHYCGIIDMNTMTVKSRTSGQFIVKDYKYNGIDRVDNSVGYVRSNCVPSCAICNRAKNSLPYDTFIYWIENLIRFRNGIRVPVEEPDDTSGPDIEVPGTPDEVPVRVRRTMWERIISALHVSKDGRAT
jgi:hypothetical protein